MTASNIPAAGYRSIGCHFSDEDNSITQEYFVRDYAALEKVLGILLPSPQPSSAGNSIPLFFHPRFPNFICRSVDVETLDKKSAQGSWREDIQGAVNWVSFFSQDIPVVKGLAVKATFRPVAAGESAVFNITDEQFDFSSQTMSLIANSPAAATNYSMHWEYGSPPALVTNLKAIVKVLPKVEIVQKRVLCVSQPTAAQQALIGCVNSAPVNIGMQNQNTPFQFPKETLLLLGLPTIRRFRWDGQFMCDIGLKFAANLYQDSIIIPSTTPALYPGQYVTWNRLYNPQLSGWGRVYVGQGNAPIYQLADLNQLQRLGLS